MRAGDADLARPAGATAALARLAHPQPVIEPPRLVFRRTSCSTCPRVHWQYRRRERPPLVSRGPEDRFEIGSRDGSMRSGFFCW